MNDLSLRKRTSTTKKQYFIVAILMAVLTVGMSIGYAYVRKDLNVNGKVSLLNTGEEAKEVTILGIDGLKAYLDNEPSPYVASETGIDFSQPSSDTNGRGLYIWHDTQNSDHPIYYYRGEVNDNNVVFGGFCWKIVRTTDTGGTKLIYNGVAPSNNTCTIDKGTSTQIDTSKYASSTNSGAKYMGYMVDDEKSAIMTQIDTWYEKFLNGYTDKLEDSVWCNDMTEGAATRLVISKSPNPISYPRKEDSYTVTETNTGNGKLNYPVALITADEAVMGGESYNPFFGDRTHKNFQYFQKTYLYTGESYWTLSPSGYTAENTKEYGSSSTSGAYELYIDPYDIANYSGISYNGNYVTDTYNSNVFFVTSYGGILDGFDHGYGWVSGGSGRSEHVSSSGTSSNYKLGNPGGSNNNYVNSYYRYYTASYGNGGVRPSIVLKSGTKPTQGDGTPANPYIVE